MRFKDLVPVFYQEGRHQGDPVTLGVGGFGRVQLVSDFLELHHIDGCLNVKSICFLKTLSTKNARDKTNIIELKITKHVMFANKRKD